LVKATQPTIDWSKSTILMNRCPHYCKFTSDINIDEEEPVTDSIHDDNEEPLSLEDGDQLFTFDVDGYLENNRTNYDYVLKYDPTKSKTKNWTNIVPKQYHDYEIFSPRRISITPRTTTMGSCHRPHPGFKPVDCKTYNLSRKSKRSSRSLLTKIFAPVRIRPSSSPMAHHFSCQEERRIATPYSRLPKVKRRHNQKTVIRYLSLANLSINWATQKSFQKWTYDGATITFVSRKMTNGKQLPNKSRTFRTTVMFFGLTNSPPPSNHL